MSGQNKEELPQKTQPSEGTKYQEICAIILCTYRVFAISHICLLIKSKYSVGSCNYVTTKPSAESGTLTL